MIRKNALPAFLLFIIACVIGSNFAPGMWLTGWDNLHPEFDFLLNIRRSFFAVWQEYQGPGLPGGMGHAADLPRQLILWVASAVLPAQILRYVWTFGMLALGTIGVYVFLWRSVLPLLFADTRQSILKTGAFFGALCYLTNMGTVQMFYAPFEAYVTHFGFLPWLLFAATRAVERPAPRRYAAFAAVSLLSATQGYVPTVFVVYCMALLTWSVFRITVSTVKMAAVRSVLWLWGITLLVNAFWLLPFAYFTATNARVTVDAKINRMATDEVFLKNRAYGTLTDALRLRGFWFDTFDFNPGEGVMAPVLGYWRVWADKPPVIIAGAVLLFISFAGVWIIIRDKKRHGMWIVAFYIFCVLLLTTATQPFSWGQDFLRQKVPLFHQIFRFPFTKFALLTGLGYSLLFGVGIPGILSRFSSKRTALLVSILAGSCLLVQSYPVFTGNLFYPALRQQIPKEYFDLFAYLRTKPETWRIANFPQSTYWGWTYERWGYTGSGLLWYGAGQPVMDRAFDVWSNVNENYYWEVSRAIYAKDTRGLENVLSKYGIHYILIDKNTVSAGNARALFTDEIQGLLAGIPTITPEKTFGNLMLFARTDDPYESSVSVTDNLPFVSPAYRWTDNDTAYGELGDYIAMSNDSSAGNTGYYTTQQNTIIYPFRSLFTKRSVDEREFDVTENDTSIILSSSVEATDAAILKSANLVYDSTKSADLTAKSVVTCGLLKPGKMAATDETDENGAQFLRFTDTNQRECLSYGIPGLPHKDGYLIAVESRHVSGRPLMFSLVNMTAKHAELETYLENTNVQGSGFIVHGESGWRTDYYILPPLAPDGLGYNPYISNDSIGSDTSVNDLRSIRIYKIPYEEMVHQKSETLNPKSKTMEKTEIAVEHPNPAYYRVQLSTANDEPKTLILSQSYDDGWLAVTPSKTFPYLVPAGKHVMVNNWENGWIISNASKASNASYFATQNSMLRTNEVTNNEVTIIIFFWPQMLEYLGFILLPIPFIFLLKRRNTSPG
jgi:hypothetical protein